MQSVCAAHSSAHATHMCTFMYSHTHTHTHARTRAHTHIHTHTCLVGICYVKGLAIMSPKWSENLWIYKVAPFNTPAFAAFSQRLVAAASAAPHKACHDLRQHLAAQSQNKTNELLTRVLDLFQTPAQPPHPSPLGNLLNAPVPTNHPFSSSVGVPPTTAASALLAALGPSPMRQIAQVCF